LWWSTGGQEAGWGLGFSYVFGGMMEGGGVIGGWSNMVLGLGGSFG
jgi:hypothetical protein